MIIYVWKILNGLAPNFTSEQMKIRTHGESSRLGRRCVLPPMVRSGEGSLREQSFGVMGPKIFNVLPAELRVFQGKLDSFKHRLDVFLANIEDTPPQPGYTIAAGGNSISQQLAYLRAQNH